MPNGIAAGSTDLLLVFCACMGWPEGSRYMQSKPYKILIQGKFSENAFGSWKFKVYFPYLSFMLSSSWKSDSSQLTFQSQIIRISWMQHDTTWYNQIFSGSQPTQSWHSSLNEWLERLAVLLNEMPQLSVCGGCMANFLAYIHCCTWTSSKSRFVWAESWNMSM